MLTSNVFAFDTENALIGIDGHIRLCDESIDLTVHPQTKGIRLLSLRSPLHVEGSFRHVDVGVDKMQLLLRGGAAIGLGMVAAPAALPAMTALDGDTPKACARLVEQAKQAGVAAPVATPVDERARVARVKTAKR